MPTYLESFKAGICTCRVSQAKKAPKSCKEKSSKKVLVSSNLFYSLCCCRHHHVFPTFYSFIQFLISLKTSWQQKKILRIILGDMTEITSQSQRKKSFFGKGEGEKLADLKNYELLKEGRKVKGRVSRGVSCER